MSCRALYLRQQPPDQGKSFVGQVVKNTGSVQSQSFFYRPIARCPAWTAEPAVSPRRTGTNLPSLDQHHVYTVVNQFLREDQPRQPATDNSRSTYRWLAGTPGPMDGDINVVIEVRSIVLFGGGTRAHSFSDKEQVPTGR